MTTSQRARVGLGTVLGDVDVEHVVAKAGVMRWRTPTGKGFRVVNPREEVDADSPIAQTLITFRRIVDGRQPGRR